MSSEQAQKFWELLKTYPKQIDMSLAEARIADDHAEDFTSEPPGVRFNPAPDVGGLWAEAPDAVAHRMVVYLFGGGFCLGSPATRRKTAGHLALAAKARVLVPNYRLAPEHPFPAAIEDSVEAYRWMLAHGADPSQSIIAGDSAGGGLAVSAALYLREYGLPLPAGIVSLSPWADLTCCGESMTTCASKDIECTREGLLRLARDYLKDANPRDPLASPVFADLRGVPPLLCIVGGEETLLDDTLRLVRNAALAGVEATAFIAPGMQHIFPIWAGSFPEADAAIKLIGDWIQNHAGLEN